MRLLQVILLLLLSQLARAEVPVIFVPNSPALADQVNTNFKYLDDQSLTISNRVDLLEGPSTNCKSNANQLTFTYNQKIGIVGQDFMIGVQPYTLIKMPFIDMPSGQKYIITMPWYKYQNQPFETTWAEDSSIFCSTTNISGYPVRTNSLQVTRRLRVSLPTTIKDMKSHIDTVLEILVGQTIVKIHLKGSTWETSLDTAIITPNDFTNPVRFTEMAAPTRMLGEIDNIIDYIIIEKLP